MSNNIKEEALRFHAQGRPGKIEVVPTKPHSTQYDLSLAYSPGVAAPCLEIQKNPEDAYKYTAKGNLVAVISNGTAVLGLGDIGALSGKPVMEGKGLLFKIFADVDVFDIEVNEKDIEKFITVVKAISPTFGGINLEDIKAPECFEIEERLKKELDIPVFHDDQHGTAIISCAGLLNALEIIGKKIEDVRIVVNGAGAAAISCTKLYVSLGARKENVLMVDTKGVITTSRTDLNSMKQQFAVDTPLKTLKEAVAGSDVFIGLSVAGVLTKEMVQSMNENPIVFAMANPDPEISYEDAMEARKDIIFATGRSDYPNQINNVLGFPFIFRGALDVNARTINEEMKVAAVRAIAGLAKENVPFSVSKAYKTTNLCFGREYLIPKPLDPRLISVVAPAVAKAAIDSGVARSTITNWDEYKINLAKRLGLDNRLTQDIRNKAKTNPKKVVFADAHNYMVLKAVEKCISEGIANPILLGRKNIIDQLIKENNLNIDNVPVIEYLSNEELDRRSRYAKMLFEKRQRKGLTYDEAFQQTLSRETFGLLMVENGDADAFISGFSAKYSEIVRPALQIIGKEKGSQHIAGMYIINTKNGPYFFADTTVNRNLTPQTLVEICLLTAKQVKKFGIEPRIAMVSFSNFGDVREGSPARVQEAIRILHSQHPDIIVDGEMQVDFALNKDLRMKKFPFTKLGDKDVNTIIFPSLSSGNIAYKLMNAIGGAEIIGPVLLGMDKPVQILQMESSVSEIINLTAIAVVDAQSEEEN